ncbi:4'-phosphopantetheinyl transferase family protein [Arthrobacter sp. HLT1-20]
MTEDAFLPSGHVWFAQAAVEPSAAQSLLLSPAERSMVGAKRDTVDRDRSATARVLLKLLLAQEFDVDPCSVSLLPPAGAGGKPVLRHAPVPGLTTPLQANVSHAGRQIIVAVTQGAGVGVDVEEHRATSFAGFDDVALSAQERRLVASLPPGLRARQRADFWVRKEAVLKALGVGLLRDPAQLDFVAAGACSTAEISGHPLLAVQLVQAPPGYSAALAVRGAAAVVGHEASFSATHITNYATRIWPIRK